MPVHHSIKSSYMPCLVLHSKELNILTLTSDSLANISTMKTLQQYARLISTQFIGSFQSFILSILLQSSQSNHKMPFQEKVSNQDEYTLQAYMQNIYRSKNKLNSLADLYLFSFRCIEIGDMQMACLHISVTVILTLFKSQAQG